MAKFCNIYGKPDELLANPIMLCFCPEHHCRSYGVTCFRHWRTCNKSGDRNVLGGGTREAAVSILQLIFSIRLANKSFSSIKHPPCVSHCAQSWGS